MSPSGQNQYVMDWYSRLHKIAETGHGDTFHGQFLNKERERLTKRVKEMRQAAAAGGPEIVLPRWRAEVRRKMLLLPPSDRIGSMSACELREVESKIAEIDKLSKRFNARRMMEVLGA
jgi:hypothetical protein